MKYVLTKLDPHGTPIGSCELPPFAAMLAATFAILAGPLPRKEAPTDEPFPLNREGRTTFDLFGSEHRPAGNDGAVLFEPDYGREEDPPATDISAPEEPFLQTPGFESLEEEDQMNEEQRNGERVPADDPARHVEEPPLLENEAGVWSEEQFPLTTGNPDSELEALYEQQELWIRRHEALQLLDPSRIDVWLEERVSAGDATEVEEELAHINWTPAAKYERIMTYYGRMAQDASNAIRDLRT